MGHNIVQTKTVDGLLLLIENERYVHSLTG